jgi:hypothetical protein
VIADPVQHFTNPVLAGIDAMSALAVIAWWFEFLHGPIGTLSTACAGAWYAYSLYAAIEKRRKK